MTKIKLYQKHSGDFQKATIEINDSETFYLMSSALITELNSVEETI